MLIDNYINFLNKKTPTIIMTGASGFIGRNLIDATVNNFKLVCIARRSQKEAGIAEHANIHWIQADIGNINNVEEFAQEILLLGGADHIIHLAGSNDNFSKLKAAVIRKNAVSRTKCLTIIKYFFFNVQINYIS